MANFAKFISDNGNVYDFGVIGGTAFSMDFGKGVAVSLGTAQGFGQVGETISNQSVSGRSISVKGVIYKNIEQKKNQIRKTFAPFSAGKLVINDKYYIRAVVKESPTLSVVKGNGTFMMQLYAPFPFFKNVKKTEVSISRTIPLFKFPINYSGFYKFGETDKNKRVIVRNSGDVSTPFECKIIAKSTVYNPTIREDISSKYLKLNLTMNAGDVLTLKRNSDNIFTATLTTLNGDADVISKVDEGSDFFELSVGDSVVSLIDSSDIFGSEAIISFEEMVVSVFEV